MNRLFFIPLYISIIIYSYSFAVKDFDTNKFTAKTPTTEDYFISFDDDIDLAKLKNECFKQNIGKSCSILGAALYDSNPRKSFEAYKKGCELKDPTSCYNVGDFYKQGDFIKKNEKKAIYYFKLSCHYSIERGENYCGGCYLLGDYFLSKGKYKDAAKYYDKDCRNACCEACYKVEYLKSKRLISDKLFKYLRKKNSKSYKKCDLMNKLANELDFEVGD